MTLVILIVGNLIAWAVYAHRDAPHWMDAPTHEKLLRLLWPTAIVVYLRYPRRLPGQNAR